MGIPPEIAALGRPAGNRRRPGFRRLNEGNFFALDRTSGKPLWDFQTGGSIVANPVSFLIDGKQHIAIAAGQASFVFGL